MSSSREMFADLREAEIKKIAERKRISKHKNVYKSKQSDF